MRETVNTVDSHLTRTQDPAGLASSWQESLLCDMLRDLGQRERGEQRAVSPVIQCLCVWRINTFETM